MEGKQKVALTFALYQNEALVRRETVTQDIVKVGKDAKSHLRVDDELASRMHAVIEVAGTDDITLIDLGNEPGTMVNGARVNKCKINPGDQLQIGGTKIVLESAEPVAVAAAAAAAAPARTRGSGIEPVRGCGSAANPFGPPLRRQRTRSAPRPPTRSAGDPFAYNNPFAPAPAPAHDEVPHDAPEGSYTYTLVKSAPDVPAEEVEDVRSSTVEVMISVGHHGAQRAAPHPRSPVVLRRRGAGKNFTCDYFIPSGEARHHPCADRARRSQAAR